VWIYAFYYLKKTQYIEIRKMWKTVRGSFRTFARGRFKETFGEDYKVVISAESGFSFACDFQITEEFENKCRLNKSKKIYGVLEPLPTKEDLVNGKNIYELVRRGQPCRLYVDIDIPTSIGISLPSIERIAELYIAEINWHFHNFFNEDLPQTWSIAANKDQSEKRSCHIVNYGMQFSTNETSQFNFFGAVKRNLQHPFLKSLENIKCGIDLSVYYRNSLMRLIYSAKMGTDRILLPLGDLPIECYFCKDYSNTTPIYECGETIPIHKKHTYRKPRCIVLPTERSFDIRNPDEWEELPKITATEFDKFLECFHPDQKYHVGYKLTQCFKGIFPNGYQIWRNWHVSAKSCLESGCYPAQCSCGRYELNLERWSYAQWRKTKPLPIDRAKKIFTNFVTMTGRLRQIAPIDTLTNCILDEAFGLRITPDIKYKEVHCRYITDGFKEHPELIDLAKILLIRSIQGSGKSSLCENIIKAQPENAKMLYVCSSRSLSFGVAETYKKYKFTRYNSSRGSLYKRRRLVTTVNSVWRIASDSGRFPNYDIVFFDELTSIIADIFSKCTKRFGSVCETLQNILRYSKKVLCLDAHILNSGIEFARISRRKIGFIFNKWLPDSKMILYKSNSRRWFDSLKTKLQNGVCIGGPINTLTLLEHLKENVIPEEVKCVFTSASDVAKNPKGYSKTDVLKTIPKNVQYWGYSQCITVGIDLNAKYEEFKNCTQFDEIYAAFSSQISTPQRFFQAIARIRTMRDNKQRVVHAMINERTVGLPTSFPIGIDNIRSICKREKLFMTSLLSQMLQDPNYRTESPEFFREVFIHHLNGLWVFWTHKLESIRYWAGLCGFSVQNAKQSDTIEIEKNIEITDFYDIPIVKGSDEIFELERTKTRESRLILKKLKFMLIIDTEKLDMNNPVYLKIWLDFLKNSAKLHRINALLNCNGVHWQEKWRSLIVGELKHTPTNFRFQLTNIQKSEIACSYMFQIEQLFLNSTRACHFVNWTEKLVDDIAAHLYKYRWIFAKFGIWKNDETKQPKTNLGIVNKLLRYMYDLTIKKKSEKCPFKYLNSSLPKTKWRNAYMRLPEKYRSRFPQTKEQWRKFCKNTKNEWKKTPRLELRGWLMNCRELFTDCNQTFTYMKFADNLPNF